MTSPDIEKVREMVAKVDAGGPLAPDVQAEALAVLEQYECWAPFFRLLKRQIEDAKTRRSEHFIRLARVQNLYLEDVFAAAETCAALIESLSMNYDDFSETVLPQLIEFEDWSAEATILSAIERRFRRKEDIVSCLERLCMLYEKKTHNEGQLTKTYERLLAADSRNVKALRYFKLVYTQSNEWEEVVGILKTLLSTVSRPQEIFRYAQELAAIFLYQLDMAEEAISVLELHCSDSPLDTSTILYDAYHRLANWQGCLRVLRQCLLNVDHDQSRAVLHMKIATLHEHLSELEAAFENFAQAAKLSPDLLDAVEGAIGIAVARKDWPSVLRWMGSLTERVKDERQVAQLKQAMRRLQDGIDHAHRP